jgi:hypothetical protein
VPSSRPCDDCGGTGTADPDLTPVEAPDARRRRTSQTVPKPEPCPNCNPSNRRDHRIDHCDCCFNETVGGCTRYVDPQRAKDWRAQHADTDPAPPDTDKEPA